MSPSELIVANNIPYLKFSKGTPYRFLRRTPTIVIPHGKNYRMPSSQRSQKLPLSLSFCKRRKIWCLEQRAFALWWLSLISPGPTEDSGKKEYLDRKTSWKGQVLLKKRLLRNRGTHTPLLAEILGLTSQIVNPEVECQWCATKRHATVTDNSAIEESGGDYYSLREHLI